MAKRPTPINRTAAVSPVRPSHPPRQRMYPDGAIDPELSDDRFECFYVAYCLTGGSVYAAWEMVHDSWDGATQGEIPSRDSLKFFAARHNWANRFLQEMLDGANKDADGWDAMAEGKLRGLKLMVPDIMRDLMLGHDKDGVPLDPKLANVRMKAAQTAMFMGGMGQSKHLRAYNGEHMKALNRQEWHAREEGDVDDPEEIRRRAEEDFKNSRSAS